MATIAAKELDARARKRYESALVAIDRGNFGYAITICSELLREEPGCLDLRKALRQAQLGRLRERRSVFRKWSGYARASFYTFYARPYLKKQPLRAMVMAEKALALNPYNKPALEIVAGASMELGNYDTAVFCFEGVVDDSCKDVGLLRRLSEALIKVGETARAIDVTERLRRLKPENVHIQELVKSASVAHSINKGKWANEDVSFRSKLKEQDKSTADGNSESESGSWNRGTLDGGEGDLGGPKSFAAMKAHFLQSLEKGDHSQARQWIAKAESLAFPDDQVELGQMRGELEIRCLECELESMRDARVEADTNGRVQDLEFKLAGLRIEEVRRLVEQFPNDYAQRLKYGELLLQLGKVDDAIQQFQVCQRSSNLREKSHFLLGKSFMAKEMYDLALDQLDLAIKRHVAMDSFRKEALYVSADCCEKLSRNEDAASRYKQIFASDISFKDVSRKLDCFYSKGDS